MPSVAEHAHDLARVTYAWGMRWWDHAEHMVWNPPGFDRLVEPARLHLVPNTAWLAYAQLGDRDAAVRAEGAAAVRKLLALQYDDPGSVLHGTYRRFLEQPHPPERPVMWEHHDPNWRQFVGTVLALIVEDFAADIAPDLDMIERSIALACTGEPDGRIPPSYSNPALMRAWLDAWWGVRCGDRRLLDRGRSFARAIVADFDVHTAFDEFNSPTYYGIDVYALRLWRCLAPDDYFAEQGTRLETALWRTAGSFYNANLENFCGPFTRSYNPDATRSVTLLSLWIWALLGRDHAPLPEIADGVAHGHDLMAGPLFARLAGPPEQYDLEDFVRFTGTRTVAQELARGRTVTAHIEPMRMVGGESSNVDWGGWQQFMPATAHWRRGMELVTLWLVDAHTTYAHADDAGLAIRVPAATTLLRFGMYAPSPPLVKSSTVRAAGIDLVFEGDFGDVALVHVDDERYELVVRALDEASGAAHRQARLSFHPARG